MDFVPPVTVPAGVKSTYTRVRNPEATSGHPGGLVHDPAGNLYGVTSGHRTVGSVDRVSLTAAGSWEFRLPHAFTGGADGGVLTGTLLRDAAGNLYGVAGYGGEHSQGVVFEVSPG